MGQQPRGIRNNNPGNLRKSSEKWFGEVSGTDTEFKTFSDPIYGLRAIAKLLVNYDVRYGLNNVSGLINRWAPTSENNTSAYVAAVAKACGVAPGQPIDVAAYLPLLLPAIVTHENGQQPYSDSQISKAIAMVTGGDDAQSDKDVASAQAQPAEPGVSAGQVLQVGDGQKVDEKVGTNLPDRARLISILAGLAKSKTIYGVLGMLGLQLLGVNAWDVAIRIGGQIYTVPDLSPLISTALASLAVWGRITAKPIKGDGNA